MNILAGFLIGLLISLFWTGLQVRWILDGTPHSLQLELDAMPYPSPI